jgi:hypothetical protein
MICNECETVAHCLKNGCVPKQQPAPVQEFGPEPFGYFQYDIRLDAWVQNRINNKGVAFYTKEKP